MFKLKETEIVNHKENDFPFGSVGMEKENFRSNTSPIDKFKNSSILKNATENMFLNNAKVGQRTSNNLKNSKKDIFSNTFNYPENLVNLHQSINKINSSSDRKNHLESGNININSNIQSASNTGNTNNFRNSNNKSVDNQNSTHFTHLDPNFYPNSNTNSYPKYPSLITPQLKKISISQTDSFTDKQAINLEDLFIQEERLWGILEALRYDSSLSYACEYYFEFLNMTSLQSIDHYFNNLETRIQINANNILEIISAMCVMISIIKNKITEEILTHLKNLLYSVHQNYLVLITMVLARLPNEFEDNMWVIKLNAVVHKKFNKLLGDAKKNYSKNEYYFLFKQNIKIISNSVSKFNSAYFKNKVDMQIYDVINDILIYVEKYSYLTVKNIMFNIKNSLIHLSMMNQTTTNYPVIPSPYLPPLPDDKKDSTYTLVLDLDETLVHYISQQNSGELLIRPGAENFLAEMSKYYEVVVFTAALQDYADWILDSIDVEKKWIKYRLYRHHASMNKNTYVKDISKLGRNLAKTIIIDNVWENFQLQPENGIFIKTWLEDKNDTSLPDLMPLLKDFVIKKVPDVRKVLRKFRDTMIRLYVKGDINPYDTLRKQFISFE